MSFVQERVHTGCHIITSVKFIRNESFLSELLGFSLQNKTLILDDLFSLCNVNAARLLYLYESSVGAREALKKTEKDIKACFYRLTAATPTRIRLIGVPGGADTCSTLDI